MKNLGIYSKAVSQKISTLPRFVIEDHPRFVSFIQAYYQWMAERGADLGLETMKLSNDIDLVPESLLSGFKNSYSPNIQQMKGDYRHFAKFLKEFYQLRGTEESFRIFFNVVYQSKVRIEFPRQYLFKPSDSVWVKTKTILVESNDDLFQLKGEDLESFIIDDVLKQGEHYVLVVEDLKEKPYPDQIFQHKNISFKALSKWKVKEIRSTNDFHTDEIIGKDGMIFKVDKIHDSGIVRVNIQSGGSGYEKDEEIECIGKGLGSGFKALITQVSDTGAIEQIKITRTGFGFNHEEVEFVFKSKSGQGAVLIPEFEPQFRKIKHLSILKNTKSDGEEKTITLDNGTEIILDRTTVTENINENERKDIPSSPYSKIHDSNFYQEFSYNIISDADTKKQEQSLRSLLHIAGLKMFVSDLIHQESV